MKYHKDSYWEWLDLVDFGDGDDPWLATSPCFEPDNDTVGRVRLQACGIRPTIEIKDLAHLKAAVEYQEKIITRNEEIRADIQWQDDNEGIYQEVIDHNINQPNHMVISCSERQMDEIKFWFATQAGNVEVHCRDLSGVMGQHWWRVYPPTPLKPIALGNGMFFPSRPPSVFDVFFENRDTMMLTKLTWK